LFVSRHDHLLDVVAEIKIQVLGECAAYWGSYAWMTLRSWFTESELVYLGWNNAKVPIMALKPGRGGVPKPQC
jgi:hypothetical protein